MTPHYKHEQQHWFQDQVRTQCRFLLRRLQASEPHFRDFTDWQEVVDLFWKKKDLSVDREDGLLRAIFQQWQRDQHPRWQVVLTLLLWPRLCGWHWRFRNYDPSDADRWQNLMSQFYRSLLRLRRGERPHRLVQKVFYDIWHELARLRARRDGRQRPRRPRKAAVDWDTAHDRREPTEAAAPAAPVALHRVGLEVVLDAVGAEDHGFQEVDRRDDVQAVTKRLDQLRRNGAISERDAALLIATKFRGRNLKDVAVELGLNFEQAKKRVQRRIELLRRACQKSSSRDCPRS